MADDMDVTQPSPRGTKRKGDDTLPLPAPRRIKALAQDVVNKIAAGEIIVAPVHALKELIENAVDAGSTALEILVKDGGLKLLQISDNGHGINKEDLPILCERFTTSKLKAFEDLTSIGTYGFRGEALASISHIAHLKVTTRTKESSCAWEAHYANGKLASPKPGQSAEPKPKAGRQGTVITVEDLFYNIPSRRRAFRSASEEYAKILDLVGRYAVHCSGVAFSCKKAGDNSGSSVSVPASAETKDRIRQIHGSAAANELVSLKAEDQRWGFKCEGWVSNANYSSKRTNLLLFINHRSVESQVIKKSVEQTYTTFLPKGGHPFVYLSLEIEPQLVDVNVHPTKREVHFLNEDEIIAMICDEIRESLSKVDTSRSFMTQSLLSNPNPKVSIATPMKQTTPGIPATDDTPDRSASRAPRIGTKKPYENNLVRTDASARKITSMLRPERTIEEAAEKGDDDMEYEYTEREPMACRLTSIKELRAEVRDAMHNELTDIISTHTFVGIVDEQKRIVAIQGGVKLFLVDYGMLCNEYFYQVGLTDFANYGLIRFNPPLPLQDLLKVAADQQRGNAGDAADEVDWDEVVESVKELLISKSPLLSEYFSIEITPEGELCSIPILIKGHMPSLAKLPQFLLRLGPHVNWEEEKACFQTLLRELASFYTPEVLPLPPSASSNDNGKGKGKVVEEDPEIALRRKKLRKAVEHVIFPACKARLVATKGLLKGVIEVANLKGLYRVFERC
ncbi:DNA mismatch repair protein mutL [Macroventuria anomochaeta]|uniref:DNA mismatch repair protein mutL n=1 Tax=Macroventuria anomochaeta TaxID=301207 RepID=A0ACB6S9Y5_9PLEO|nr:DNA mismatch repair protein mutL [Macroventuria anomochaeta]KAF2631085.1 DNA mismatch repair protein mutL [Macroventuria anomochaeta]